MKWTLFPRYRPFVRGINRWPMNSPHKGQWRGALYFLWPAPWINGWVNNGEAGDLRRHRARYDVIVMENLSAVDCFIAFNCNMRFTDIISNESFFAGNNYGLPIIWMTIWYHSDQSIRYKAMMIKGSFECQIRSVFARPHFMQISKRLDNKAVR